MAKESKPIWKRWWFWVLIIIIVIAFASCGGEDEDSTTDQKAGELSDNTTKDEETKEEVLSIGQPVTLKKFEYVVKGANETNEIKSDNEFIESKTTTGKFIVVDYTIKNLDSEARMVDSELFRIKSGDNEFKPMQDADIMMLLGDANLFLEEVNPQMSREGKIVFEVPADLATYDLQLSSGLGWSGGEYKTVKLK
ncbi:DUF4352 domain-containing protein [Bacillus benzoevorans]|uniref:DUF4352 domain-containing protein n=1 Tax=Bacillus benzoevorans TaxID=1456 RepID=A0A7X0HW29_9BACI|nr:DUF4352 domain-containing protein [Bacillus benzoevorans]MBB6447938.1 hypothetical protein [Bacillus benzoevorans]